MRRTFCRGVFILLALVLMTGRTMHAQSTTDGAIGGTVYDSSGGTLASAKITVTNIGTNLTREENTDDKGYFRVANLQPATYTVTIEAQGFEQFRAEQVVVQLGSVTELS